MSTPYNPSNNPIPPSPGVWPPPPGGSPYNVPTEENTSGMHGAIPPQIAALKWNWGAFLLSFLWTVNHKMAWGWGILVLSLLSRAPHIGPLFSLVNLGIAIYLGLKGHQLGWQNRQFAGGLSEYFAVQNAWLKWGIGVLIVGFVIGIAIGVFAGVAVFNAGMHGASPSSP